MDKNIFSQRLKEERKRCKLTQQQLADEINFELENNKITRTSITRYENGTRKPDLQTLTAISCVLNVDSDYLLGLTDKKHVFLLKEELGRFSDFISSITEKDNYTINDQIWSILSELTDILELSIENNVLDSTLTIFEKMQFIYAYSIRKSPKKYENIDEIINLLTSKEIQIKKDIQIEIMEPLMEYVPDIFRHIDFFGIDKLPNVDKKILYYYYSYFTDDPIPENIKPLLNEYIRSQNLKLNITKE